VQKYGEYSIRANEKSSFEGWVMGVEFNLWNRRNGRRRRILNAREI